jgi:hypothetical protein
VPGPDDSSGADSGYNWLCAVSSVLVHQQPVRLCRYTMSCAKRVTGATEAHVRCRAAQFISTFFMQARDWGIDSAKRGEDRQEMLAHVVGRLVDALRDDADARVRSAAARALGSAHGARVVGADF